MHLNKFLTALAIVLSVGNAAHASIYQVELKGQAIDGIDVLGFYGPPHTSLIGADFSIIYTVDTRGAGAHVNASNTGLHYEGGVIPVIASATINGITREMPAPTFVSMGSSIQCVPECVTVYGIDIVSPFLRLPSDTYEGETQLSEFTIGWSVLGIHSINVHDVPETSPLGPHRFIGATFLNYTSNVPDTSGMFADMLLESVSTKLISVPEPSSWATMLMGFIVAGTTLRRRRVISG